MYIVNIFFCIEIANACSLSVCRWLGTAYSQEENATPTVTDFSIESWMLNCTFCLDLYPYILIHSLSSYLSEKVHDIVNFQHIQNRFWFCTLLGPMREVCSGGQVFPGTWWITMKQPFRNSYGMALRLIGQSRFNLPPYVD